MSIEGPGKKYRPEETTALEKTRIQDSEEAHEEANMLSVEAGEEKPTAEDYDRALALLEELQEKAGHGSESVDKIIRPIRNITAGSLVALAAALDVIPLLLLTVVGYTGMAPKGTQEELRQKVGDRMLKIDYDYERFRDVLTSARERLEKWKAEAEEFAKKQTEF